jgi:hypothetical protein
MTAALCWFVGPAWSGESGQIFIISTTEGARVLVNGQTVGVVPMDDAIVRSPGRYAVSIEKAGFVTYAQTIDLSAGEEVDVMADLVASGGVLKLKGAKDLTAYIDTVEVGPLPLEVVLPLGQHKVEVKYGGRIVLSKTLVVAPGKSFSFTAKAPAPRRVKKKERAGSIEVISSTRGAGVIVDGRKVGTVPLETPIGVPAGTYEVRLEKPGFLTYMQEVTVTPGETNEVFAELIGVKAILNVEGRDGARVVVDDKVMGVIPFSGALSPGKHRVEVFTPGASKLVRNVSVVAGDEVRLSYNPALASSSPSPGASSGRAWYKEWWVWTGAGVVVAGGVATAVALSMGGIETARADHTLQVP